MINREQFINEIAEVVNRNSMEKAFNDTPDFILARIAVEAMEMFTRASAHRDDFHEFRTADYDRNIKGSTRNRRRSMCQKMWKQWRLSLLICSPGSKIQIQRVDLKKNPRNKRRVKNQRKNRKGGKQ